MANTTLDTWTVSEQAFPVGGRRSEKLRFLVNYAMLAPSRHNTQPWLFKVTGDAIEVYADQSRRLPVADPCDRELMMSCGAALLHLRVAVRYFGYVPWLERFPGSAGTNPIARLSLGDRRKASREERALFASIPRRRTHRTPFEDRKVSRLLLLELQMAASDEGAWLYVLRKQNARNEVADLVAEGDQIQGADKRFRRELSEWVRPNRTARGDGVPGYAFGIGDLASHFAPFAAERLRWGQRKAARDRRLVASSPVLAVVGTDTDTPLGWLAAGQALARVVLRARADDVMVSCLNQPVEVADLRSRLLDILGRPGFPQVVLRLGYGSELKPTPRRMVSEVLI